MLLALWVVKLERPRRKRGRNSSCTVNTPIETVNSSNNLVLPQKMDAAMLHVAFELQKVDIRIPAFKDFALLVTFSVSRILYVSNTRRFNVFVFLVRIPH